MSPVLVAVEGPLKGHHFTIETDTSIGRGSSNTLQIEDTAISRYHCEILRVGESFLLRDLASRNGTFLNDEPIDERRLASGDKIRVGNSLFIFALELSRAATAAALDDLLTASTAMDISLEQGAETERRAETAPPDSGTIARHGMLGKSAPMRALYRQIDRAAPTEASVFITGESGTGKELVARALHRGSPRADEAFVVVNCAALPEALLESEFFGHEKGAFTGALAQHKGRFEIADGGTVFLDEIGEMPPALQAKLLRVLQEHEFERVGGTGPLRTDVRVIAATHRDVTTGIQQGTFREDLYYRLKVISLHVPALRQREEDILPLAQHFLRRFAKEFHREVSNFDDEARAWLLNYQWPGNVRELEHAIEQAVIMGSSNVVRAQDLRETVRSASDPSGPMTTRYHDALEETRREVILRALKQAGGVYTEAAKLLGIHPVHLHRLMRGMHLKSEIKRDS